MGCQAFARVPEDRVPGDRTYRRRSGARRSYECLKIGCQAIEHIGEDRVPGVRTSAQRSGARRSYECPKIGCQAFVRVPGDLRDESSRVGAPRKNLVVDLQGLASGALPAELAGAGEAALREEGGKPGGDEEAVEEAAEVVGVVGVKVERGVAD